MPRSLQSWVITILMAFAIVSGAMLLKGRRNAAQEPVEMASREESLSRTRALVAQKCHSLETYNSDVALVDLLAFLSRHTGKEVGHSAFEELSRQMRGKLIPDLWIAAQEESRDERVVLDRPMAHAIHRYFPHETLANADVVFYPESRVLRVVVSEPAGDHLRDSAWHWRWIGQYIEALSLEECQQHKEIDVYAAEELSEFLSSFAIAVMELAARRPGSGSVIDEKAIAWTMAHLPQPSALDDETPVRLPDRLYSEVTRDRVRRGMPDEMFADRSHDVGLDFIHRPSPGNRRLRAQLEVPVGIAGGGASSGDIDGDGYDDLYLAGANSGGLYLNKAGRRFENVTRPAGITSSLESRAGYFVDFDNDGDLDLFITHVAGPNSLFENTGTLPLRDISSEIGLLREHQVSHEAVWFDMDNDGLLDLYVGNFGQWDKGVSPVLGRRNTTAGSNRLYHQRLVDGQRKLIEIGVQAGVADRGWTHCVGALDFDRDGRMDLFSLNDFGASLVYHNRGAKGFSEVSRELRLDAMYNAMCFTELDLDGSGEPAFYVSQIMKLTHRQRYRKPSEETEVVFTPESLENMRVLITNRLYARDPSGAYFRDEHDRRIEPAYLGWAWDISAMDYENDGDPDLLVLNGTEAHVPIQQGAGKAQLAGAAYVAQFNAERNVFYASEDGYFYNVSDYCGLAYKGNSRGSTFFDFDRDGDLDVVINDYDGPARYFENRQTSENHWIGVRLDGGSRNRFGVGARITVLAGKHRWSRTVVSGSGFLSQNPMMLHFGLGMESAIEGITVLWPDGVKQDVAPPGVDRVITIRRRGS